MIKFSHEGQEFKLVFKHGMAMAPTISFMIPEIRRELRAFMSNKIANMPIDNRRKPIRSELTVEGELSPKALQVKPYYTTSAFIVNLTTKTIEAGPFTRVCVPPDIFSKEVGRIAALEMLQRKYPELGDKAISAYDNRY